MLKLGWFCLAAAGCATPGIPADLPLVSPPVRAATPPGLTGATVAGLLGVDAMLSASEFRDRFFNPAGGPTDVFRILGAVDERLDEANAAAIDSPRPCLEQEPVTYALSPFGQDVAFAARCYRRFGAASSPAAFMQFGRREDVTYLYVTGGAARVAARITQAANEAVVDVWYGVGYTNASCGTDGTFDGCSYAVTQIHAEPALHAFEMSVAGIGVGFCGIRIRSDGTSLYGVGSADMGMTCGEPAMLCVAAADLSAPGSCDSLATFSIPALGRKAGAGAHAFGASTYPSPPNITLDGTSSDSLGFGPADAPTPGVADFDAR
jgi:hypothetical protein